MRGVSANTLSRGIDGTALSFTNKYNNDLGGIPRNLKSRDK